MMETIIQFFKNTPTYVYFIFIYLVYAGIKASKDRVVSIFKSCILGALFFYLATNTVYRSFPDTGFIWGVFALFLSLGSLLGYLQVYKKKIQVDKNKKLISLPGTWSTIVILFIIFTGKYYLGYMHHEKIEVFQNTGFQFFGLAVMGISSGLFMGKMINYFYRFFKGPYTDLEVSK